MLAYSNSFGGPEILDDPASISKNPHIRSLWPISEAMTAPPQETVAGRPIVCLSLAINYQISELDVWSYHAFNLAIHLLAGLSLFGIIRRTLRCERLVGAFGGAAEILAGVCALLWVLHPLQTGAVDYMIQRAETMMGLFYLLTLYCAIRGMAGRREGLWQIGAVVFCAVGMATKEVMVTAPIMVLVYDRVFAGRSFREIFARRWKLYAGLAATWVVLALIVSQGPRNQTAGFAIKITPLQYASGQCEVIMHYLRLAFWPHPLVLDYNWPVPSGPGEVLLPAVGIWILLAATALALYRRPGVGFLGFWFFVILGPTSSFLPIDDLAFEHRMYLSLAAVTTALPLAAYAIGRRIAGKRQTVFVVAGLVVAAAVAAVLGWRTHVRNGHYSSAVSIWSETVNSAPHNFRAHGNLGWAHDRAGNDEPALKSYAKAIELNPGFHAPRRNRGLLYLRNKQWDLAIADFTRAIEILPLAADDYNSRAAAYLGKGDKERALADVNKAIELNPGFDMARQNRRKLLQLMGRDSAPPDGPGRQSP